MRRLQQGVLKTLRPVTVALPLHFHPNRQPLPATCPLASPQHIGTASSAAQLPANSVTRSSCHQSRCRAGVLVPHREGDLSQQLCNAFIAGQEDGAVGGHAARQQTNVCSDGQVGGAGVGAGGTLLRR